MDILPIIDTYDFLAIEYDSPEYMEISLANGEPYIVEMLECMYIEKIYGLLEYLAAHNNIDMFKKIVEKVDGINLSFHDNCLLKIAVVNDSVNVLSYLLENNIDPSVDDHFAVKVASYKTLPILLEYGANAAFDDNLAICYAMWGGNLEKIKLLHQNGADIHARNNFLIRTASRHYYFDVVRYLVEAGVDPHIDDDYPFRQAVSAGDVENVQFLLDYGAKIENLTVKDLESCIKTISFQTVKLLCDVGVDFTIINNQPIDPNNQNTLNMIRCLLEQRVDPDKLVLSMFKKNLK